MPFLIPIAAAPVAATIGAGAATAGAFTAASAALIAAEAAAAAATISTIGTIATIGGIAASVIGGIQTSQALKFQGKLQEKLGIREAKRLELEATERRKAGKAAVAIEKSKLRRNVEDLRARRAASGVQVTGTPLLVELEAVKVGTLDAATLGHNIEIGARQRESAADIARIRGKAAKREGKIRAGISLFRTGRDIGMFVANRELAA